MSSQLVSPVTRRTMSNSSASPVAETHGKSVSAIKPLRLNESQYGDAFIDTEHFTTALHVARARSEQGLRKDLRLLACTSSKVIFRRSRVRSGGWLGFGLWTESKTCIDS